MTKRNTFWLVAIVLLLVSIIGGAYGINQVKNITLTETEIQEKINSKLPFSKNNLNIEKVDVVLSKGVITFSLKANGKKFGQTFDTSARVAGELIYNNLDGTFHFKPYAVDILELKTGGKTISDKAVSFIEKFVDSKKVNKNKQVIAEQIEKWAEASIQKTAAWVLIKTPIYTFPNDFKGNTMRMSLESVEVNDGSLTAHVSFWQFTKMILIYMTMLILSIGLFFGLVAGQGNI